MEAAGPIPTDKPVISASAATGYDVTEVAVFADSPIHLEFDNKQAGVPHNVAIYDGPDRKTEYFVGEIIDGAGQAHLRRRRAGGRRVLLRVLGPSADDGDALREVSA